MTDKIKTWLNERQRVYAAADTGHWYAFNTGVGSSALPPDEAVFEDAYMQKAEKSVVVDAHNHFPVALAAIEAVLALHRPESHFVVLGYEDVSFSSVEDAEEFVGGPVDDAEEFKLCVECKRVEDGADHNTEEIGYETSLYPCKTRRALEGVIDNE